MIRLEPVLENIAWASWLNHGDGPSSILRRASPAWEKGGGLCRSRERRSKVGRLSGFSVFWCSQSAFSDRWRFSHVWQTMSSQIGLQAGMCCHWQACRVLFGVTFNAKDSCNVAWLITHGVHTIQWSACHGMTYLFVYHCSNTPLTIIYILFDHSKIMLKCYFAPHSPMFHKNFINIHDGKHHPIYIIKHHCVGYIYNHLHHLPSGNLT